MKKSPQKKLKAEISLEESKDSPNKSKIKF